MNTMTEKDPAGGQSFELLDRYLQSFKTFLPRALQEDTVAELKSNLQAKIEDRQSALGRPLHDSEVECLLKEQEHPMLAASRYRTFPLQHLIGPALSPFYWYSLLAVLGIVLAIELVSGAVALLAGQSAGTVLLNLFLNSWVGGIYAIGWVTLIFAVLEYYQVKFLNRWSPRSLPRLIGNAEPASRTTSLVHMVLGAAFICLLLADSNAPMIVLGAGARLFGFSPSWQAARYGILLLVAVGTIRATVALVRPLWTTFALAARTIVNSLTLLMIVLLLRCGSMLVLLPGTAPLPQYITTLGILNSVIVGVLILACLFSLYSVASDLRRYFNRRRQSPLQSSTA